MNRHASQVAMLLGLALAAGHVSVRAAEANPRPYMLSTSTPSFFLLNHGSGAMYYRFEPAGRFEQIAREHMGVISLGGGIWQQASNGLVTLRYGGRTGRADEFQKVSPMAYRGEVFLLWPEKSYGNRVERVMDHINAPTHKPMVYNEFMISGAEFTNGTSRAYPFRQLKPSTSGTNR